MAETMCWAGDPEEVIEHSADRSKAIISVYTDGKIYSYTLDIMCSQWGCGYGLPCLPDGKETYPSKEICIDAAYADILQRFQGNNWLYVNDNDRALLKQIETARVSLGQLEIDL